MNIEQIKKLIPNSDLDNIDMNQISDLLTNIQNNKSNFNLANINKLLTSLAPNIELDEKKPKNKDMKDMS